MGGGSKEGRFFCAPRVLRCLPLATTIVVLGLELALGRNLDEFEIASLLAPSGPLLGGRLVFVQVKLGNSRRASYLAPKGRLSMVGSDRSSGMNAAVFLERAVFAGGLASGPFQKEDSFGACTRGIAVVEIRALSLRAGLPWKNCGSRWCR